MKRLIEFLNRKVEVPVWLLCVHLVLMVVLTVTLVVVSLFSAGTPMLAKQTATATPTATLIPATETPTPTATVLPTAARMSPTQTPKSSVEVGSGIPGLDYPVTVQYPLGYGESVAVQAVGVWPKESWSDEDGDHPIPPGYFWLIVVLEVSDGNPEAMFVWPTGEGANTPDILSNGEVVDVGALGYVLTLDDDSRVIMLAFVVPETLLIEGTELRLPGGILIPLEDLIVQSSSPSPTTTKMP